MIETALATWFALTAISAGYVAWDSYMRNPELGIMKVGWVLVTLYGGPVAAAVYVLSCKEPRAGAHEAFTKPLWKQSLGSTIHCMAGDATGIILAAAITTTLGLPMRFDLVIEYALGFGFGLLIFQALFMRKMLGGSYASALRRSFLPEWLSMNAVMAGMIPVMVALMSSDMKAMDPTSLRFWGTMSLATLVGGVIAYPVNVWLVAAGLKHGMGTVRVLGEGGHSLSADPTVPGGLLSIAKPDQKPSAEARMNDSAGMAKSGTSGMPAMASTRGEASMSASAASPPQIAAVTILTLIALGGGIVLAERSGGLSSSQAEMSHTRMNEMSPTRSGSGDTIQNNPSKMLPM